MSFASFDNKSLRIGPFGFMTGLSIEKYFLLIIVLWLPLKDWTPVTTLFGGRQGLVAPIAVLLLALLITLRRGFKINFGRTEKAFVIFLFSVLASAGLSVAVYGQLSPILKDSIVVFELVFLYLLGTNLKEEDLVFTIKWGIFEALLISMFGIWQFWSKVPVNPLWVIPGEALRSRAFATFLSPNGLASYLLPWFWLSAWFGLKKNKAWLVTTTFILFAIFATYSRSSLLGLAFGVLVLVMLNIKKINLKIAAVLAVTGLGSAIFFYKRIISIFTLNYNYYSDEAGRNWAWNNVVHIIPNHIFFGVGSGMYGGETATKLPSPVYLEGIQHGFVSTYLTDNQYLQILITQGFLGVVSYLYLFVCLTLRMLSSAKKDLYFGGVVLAIWVCYSTQGFFENIWFIQAAATLVWLLIGFGVRDI